jgi:hypothetical protein
MKTMDPHQKQTLGLTRNTIDRDYTNPALQNT